MDAVLVMLGDELEKLDEVDTLAWCLDYHVRKRFIQHKPPRPRYLIGAGKLDEIKEYVEEQAIGLVIFENFLGTGQILAIEDELKVPVIDRFDLILNVFEVRAHSSEAKLQIELARLKRKIPYIKRVRGRRVKEEHPGYGGSGEFIIHSTISGMHKRIKTIEGALDKFEYRTAQQRLKRKKRGKIVSLAGYTNVGKTTLLNALTHASKPTVDELFTTLRTKTAALAGSNGIFVNDTIGFLRELPHELIYAFRATLSDIRHSDLIVLVLDGAEPMAGFDRKMCVCEQTLTEIGASGVPILYVLNKIDIASADAVHDKETRLCEAIKLSALKGIGIETLVTRIKSVLT